MTQRYQIKTASDLKAAVKAELIKEAAGDRIKLFQELENQRRPSEIARTVLLSGIGGGAGYGIGMAMKHPRNKAISIGTGLAIGALAGLESSRRDRINDLKSLLKLDTPSPTF